MKRAPKEPRRFLTAKHLADLCDADLKAVHNWAQKNEAIPFFTTPGGHLRFLPEDVVAFLEKHRYPVPAWVRALAARGDATPASTSKQTRPPGVSRTSKYAQVGVAVLVRRADGALLLGFRRGSHGAGTWAPPGGRLEVGEDVAECAARELLEETGIRVSAHDVRDLGARTVDHFEERGGETWVTLWCAVDLSGSPEAELCEPEKCAEWRWRTSDDLGDDPLFAPFSSLLADSDVSMVWRSR